MQTIVQLESYFKTNFPFYDTLPIKYTKPDNNMLKTKILKI